MAGWETCSGGNVRSNVALSSGEVPSSGTKWSGFGSGLRKKSGLVVALCRSCCNDPAEIVVDADGAEARRGNECGEAEKTFSGGRQWTVSHGGSDGRDLFRTLSGLGVVFSGCFFSTGCLHVKNGCTCIGLGGDITSEVLSISMPSSGRFRACMSSIVFKGNGPGVTGLTGELSSMTMMSIKRDKRVILH